MIKIGNRTIGDGQKPYLIAECGMNHNGSLELAKRHILEAAKSGADAIKFQTYTADDLVVKGTPKFWDYHEDAGKDQHQAYADLKQLSYEDYPELMRFCEENNIEFLSTPFSIQAADYLNSIGMKAFKIASSDMSTLPFLRHIARFGKPILLSTGASTPEEIEESIGVIEAEGNNQIIILQCTLCYPTKPEFASLQAIRTMDFNLSYPVGLSDHTLGVFPSVVAIAKGAVVLEKHFTVDKTLLGNADHWLSIDPKELKELVCMANDIHTLNGNGNKYVLPCEEETRKYDKRSWVANEDIEAGITITEDMLTWKRPGTGIWPNVNIVGRVAKKDIKKDTTITNEMV
jgi:N,N'-diacetyllegionaminate synthase